MIKYAIISEKCLAFQKEDLNISSLVYIFIRLEKEGIDKKQTQSH